ncbi:MAG: M48 family metallopeptidase [Bacteroidales bacterium]|nr:M48 family metallopeptidase [Bacteroidales bacterium]MCF8403588.1 M48 family metallopeptidase [Bacteroidales bacterium]
MAMKKHFSLILTIVLLFGCTTVPITGRKQLSIIPNNQILPLSYTSYQDVLKESKLSTDTEKVLMIKKVGSRIQNSVEQFMAKHDMADQLEGYDWEFNLIEDNVLNAWCMPGGKVAFYTGILPVCQDEAGVAVVMGHEVAHAIANHGRERMSQGLIQQMGGMALAIAIQDKPEETQALYYTAYAIGSTYGAILPYSRLHESESDKLGLIFMAMAGYDPTEAPKFWERMAAATGGQEPPEWLSTHPSHSSRIEDLKAYIPKAMKYYQPTAGTIKR